MAGTVSLHCHGNQPGGGRKGRFLVCVFVCCAAIGEKFTVYGSSFSSCMFFMTFLSHSQDNRPMEFA